MDLGWSRGSRLRNLSHQRQAAIHFLKSPVESPGELLPMRSWDIYIQYINKYIYINNMYMYQWEFQDPKMEVRWYHISGHILGEYSLKLRPEKLALYIVGTSNLGSWNGFQTFFFSIIYGIILPIDFHIYQRGWNHQPVKVSEIWFHLPRWQKMDLST